MTTLREAAQQALEALELWDTVGEQPSWHRRKERQDAITTLRAALAQQAEPVDVGLLEYRGNSVAFIHQKMTAYRTGIDVAWDAFRAKGLHPDGKTSLADMIAKYTAPPQRKPLTEEAAALTAQRDALLEALKELTPPMPPADAPCHVGLVLQEKCAHCGRIARARAAIKAVEETK